jgi:hypothetical protein
MAVFKLPISVLDDLNKLIRDYRWGVEKGKSKTHLVSWKLMRSEMHRGLGFRDMQLFNQVLLARQAWQLIAFLESLFARFLKACYYPHVDLIDTVFIGSPSSTWTSTAHGLELLKNV